LRWKREFSKTTDNTGKPINNTTTPYETKTVENNTFIGVQDWVADAFNIVTLTQEQADALASLIEVKIKTHERSILDGKTGNPTTIKVREFDRLAGLVAPDAKIARLEHPTLIGATGKFHKIGIGFPSFFKIPMICQALGQMIAETKNPGYCQIEPSYNTYPIITNTAKAPLPGASCGAWVVTAITPPVNTDEVEGAPDGPTKAQSKRVK
jgi:hypothetical protein